MKIYSKSNFMAGLLGLGALILFFFDIIAASWWQWLIAIAMTAKFLYTGLTKSGSRREKHLTAHYEEAAVALHGKHHALKTNLPWILTGSFFVVALALLFLFEVWIPVWSYCIFVVILLAAGFYSMLIQQSIVEYIDEHFPETTEE